MTVKIAKNGRPVPIKVQIEPLRDMLVIVPGAPPLYGGRLVIIQGEQPAMRGKVIAIGPEVRDVEVGQQILFSRLQGFELNVGQPVILLPERAVIASL